MGRGAPQEYARVPEKLAGGDKHLSQFEVGLLGKGLHLADIALCRFSYLYVAIACLGPRGGDTECQQGVVAVYEIEAGQHARLEQGLAGYHVVGWGDYHRCLWVAGRDMPRSPGYAGCCIATCRLEEYLVGRYFGQLLGNKVGIAFVGHYQYIGGRYKIAYAVIAHLQQGTARAEKVYKLLWQACTAVGPKSATDAATHYHAITVLVIFHHSLYYQFAKLQNFYDMAKSL